MKLIFLGQANETDSCEIIVVQIKERPSSYSYSSRFR
jgi:hypothetical protein